MSMSMSASVPSGAVRRCAGRTCRLFGPFTGPPLEKLVAFAVGGVLPGCAGQARGPLLGGVGGYAFPHEGLDAGELIKCGGRRGLPGGDAGGPGLG
jgi:hypothetical protein